MRKQTELGMKYFGWYYIIILFLAILYAFALIWLIRDFIVAAVNGAVLLTYYSAFAFAIFPVVGSVYLVFNLKKFKKRAYKVNIALIIYMTILCIINLLMLYLPHDSLIDDKAAGTVLWMVLWSLMLVFWVLNLIYFKKRKYLFKNVNNKSKNSKEENIQTALYGKDAKNAPGEKSFKNQTVKELKKRRTRKGLMIVAAVIVCIGYIVALVIETANFTPYSKKEVYISQQNVPHSVDMGIEFSEFDGFSYDYHSNRAGTNVRYVSTLNIPIALTELAVTTAIPTALMFLMYRKRKSNDNS